MVFEDAACLRAFADLRLQVLFCFYQVFTLLRFVLSLRALGELKQLSLYLLFLSLAQLFVPFVATVQICLSIQDWKDISNRDMSLLLAAFKAIRMLVISRVSILPYIDNFRVE